MRISTTLRNQAILIAACEASNPDVCEDTYGAAKLLGLPTAAARLAYQAWEETYCTHSDQERVPSTPGGYPCRNQAVSGEAEALLRDGWSPGEPVVKL